MSADRRLALALALALAGGAAAAQEVPGAHQRACADLTEAHRRAAKPLEARTANFMLFGAAERGCDALIRTLLAEGASTEARNAGGNSALEIAAAMGQIGHRRAADRGGRRRRPAEPERGDRRSSPPSPPGAAARRGRCSRPAPTRTSPTARG